MELTITENLGLPVVTETVSSDNPDHTIYEVNGYKSRISLELDLGGEKKLWFSVKGGPPGLDPQSPGTYEIFFDPNKRQWLKVAYPNRDGRLTRVDQLRFSVKVARTAFQVAQAPDLIPQLSEYNSIKVRGLDAYGFVTPHIGPSLEFLAGGANKNKMLPSLPPDTVELLVKAYTIGYLQAKRLYTEYGYWMSDANPGNILIHQISPNKSCIVLIDFSNNEQVRNHYPDTPEPLRSTLLSGNCGVLKNIFQTQLSRLVNDKAAKIVT